MFVPYAFPKHSSDYDETLISYSAYFREGFWMKKKVCPLCVPKSFNFADELERSDGKPLINISLKHTLNINESFVVISWTSKKCSGS